MNQREQFLRHVGQTSPAPIGLEVEKAEGIYLFDGQGGQYIDLISGVSVSNVGHRHPKVIEAIQKQLNKYLHLMVYGEYVQTPQVQLATKLAEYLPGEIDCVYFVNSGSEAIEGALKLAKRATGRYHIVSFKNAYHGGTHGALSIMGDENLRNRFRPLLPGVQQIEFNNISDLSYIDSSVACVVIEPIQGEGGVIVPDQDFMAALRKRCSETGTLLIFDEIQTGFGRTGTLFASQHFNIVPDIICMAKGMGGGMPIGAFAAKHQLMNMLTHDPVLGHITTFGGHPVSCAAALASLEVILSDDLSAKALAKGNLFRKRLVHPSIKGVRGIGLFLAVTIDAEIDLFLLLHAALQCGVLLDPFLYCPNAFRIAPPLTISDDQIEDSCNRILLALDSVNK